MDQRSVFFEEWLRSLREQYKHVVRIDDRVTLPTLTAVMHNVGFGEDDLAQLRVEATMHIDDVGADFTPDLDVLNKSPGVQAHPAECLCPQCAPIDETQFDAEGQPLQADPEESLPDTGRIFPTVASATAELEDEPAPKTFEDSLQLAEETPDDGVEAIDESSEDADATEADNPQQMSLF